MKTANNPFLAANQNKTSNVGFVHDSNSTYYKNNTTNVNNRKLRRQTISDPHAYIQYISFYQYPNYDNGSRNQCIPKSCANTLVKCPTTTATVTAITTKATVTNDKIQSQCQEHEQEQQQLQQISLQFQGITLSNNNNNNDVDIVVVDSVDVDDVAKSKQQNDKSNRLWYDVNKKQVQSLDRNPKEQQIQTKTETETELTAYQILLKHQKQMQQQHEQSPIVEETNNVEQNPKCYKFFYEQKNGNMSSMIDDKLAQQIKGSSVNNNINSKEKMFNFYVNRNNWLGTYPTTRFKKMSNFYLSLQANNTATTTITTTSTRMTPKIVPTIKAQPVSNYSYSASSQMPPSTLRKHHSFHIQPTRDLTLFTTDNNTTATTTTTTNNNNNNNNKYLYKTQQHDEKESQYKTSILKEVIEVEEGSVHSKIKEEVVVDLAMGNNFNTWSHGGPLVYRPLTLNEKHAFKPISPRPTHIEQSPHTTISNTSIVNINNSEMPEILGTISCGKLVEIEIVKNKSTKNEVNVVDDDNDDDGEKSLQSSEFSIEMREELGNILYKKDIEVGVENKKKDMNNMTVGLHPAASLEVLEALTQSNPELIYAANQPGSRINLHTQLSALNCQTNPYNNDIQTDIANGVEVKELRAKLQAKLCETELSTSSALHSLSSIRHEINEAHDRHSNNKKENFILWQ